MMIYYPLLREPIEFTENTVNVLIIENPRAFREAVRMLMLQSSGESGDYILSEDFVPIEISKHAEVITDIFEINFDSKKITTKLNQLICEQSRDYYDEVQNVISEINKLGSELALKFESYITFDVVEDVSGVIKLLNFSIDKENMDLSEQILEYIRICRNFFKKRLFIFINLKSCLTPQELELLYKSILYEKFDVLLIESFQKSEPLQYEQTKIIDIDLCEI